MILFPDGLDSPRTAPDLPGALAVRVSPALLLTVGRTIRTDEGALLLHLFWRPEIPSHGPEADTPAYALPKTGFT